MPRKPRMYLPGIPAHVVQRGNNRGACFFTHEDYLFYCDCLAQGLRRYDVRLHAYVLMTNHVHLLLTPADGTGISRLMQHLARLYVLYVNRTYRRSGTLWEGRHKASLIQTETYLLACHRYIEMNPVAAGVVSAPEEYRWSSYCSHAFGQADRFITDHPLYPALGPDRANREYAYRQLFRHALAAEDRQRMRESLTCNHPWGTIDFARRSKLRLAARSGRRSAGDRRDATRCLYFNHSGLTLLQRTPTYST